jgi:hypothetical protein
MNTQVICKDCGQTLEQQVEKAIGDGTYAVVWYGDKDWVCLVTGDEHVPGEYAGERDLRGYAICGQDFMAGTICSDQPGHEGPHSCVCQICEGDWMNGTCTCPSEDEEPEFPMDPVEALTYAILALNTDQAPDATSGNDLLYLELNAERALAALDRIRDFIIASGEDLPDYVFGKDES